MSQREKIRSRSGRMLTASPCAKDVSEKSRNVDQTINLWLPAIRWLLQYKWIQDVDCNNDYERDGIGQERVYDCRICDHREGATASQQRPVASKEDLP